MNEQTVTISVERYGELIRNEVLIQLLKIAVEKAEYSHEIEESARFLLCIPEKRGDDEQ